VYDVKITGGRVVDGTGAPARHADVGIRDGRIVAIGRTDEEARQEIDARGKVVAPGFIDVHTHYDAMVFWNGSLSPSSCHGITTVVGGNCGFSIAPLSPDAGDYLMRMLARVEGMPLESLREGVPWDWSSFGEYLDRLEGQLAINAGFLVGHSAIRRVVMGERAVGHEATPDELARMVELLRVSCEEGGLGFSTSLATSHNDGESRPVPSRHASRDELVALARAIRDVAGTTLELVPDFEGAPEESRRLMTELSLAANRPLNWNALFVDASMGEMVADGLANSDYARERGAEVVAMTVPQAASFRINLHSGFIFDILHGWPEFFRLPVSERMERLRDPAYRKELDTNARERSGEASELARWEEFTVCETFSEANARHEGRTLREVGEMLGVTPFDALCDLALADDLRTQFLMQNMGNGPADWQARGRVWLDDRAVVGASDAGAHLDMIDTFATSTQVLGNGVREHGLLSLEEGVRQLTDVPARLYGLVQRGRIEEGWHADLVVFDADTVGCGPTHTRFDLPAGAGRLYADAEGIEHVLVGGVEIVRGGKDTGARPGTVLRAGRDTETVEVPGGH
jgi:N-acyl-D-aspartate/D-glutamate deacylase